MNIWIVYYRRAAEYNRAFIECLIEKGLEYGMTMKLVYVEDIHSFLAEEIPDAVIARYINPALSAELENCGIRVFNNSNISRICNNKAATIRTINNLNSIIHIPTIVISDNPEYSDIEYIKNNPDVYNDYPYIKKYDDMLDRISIQYNKKSGNITYIIDYNSECISYSTSDYIIKSVTGHGGREVSLLSEYSEYDWQYGTQEKDAADSYSDKMVIQPKLECGGRDIRVYVIGHSIIGAVLRTANDGFKSNYSLGGSVSLYQLSDRQMEVINRIIEHYEFDYVGIDFLLDVNDELIFNEIEDVVGARMLSVCSDIDYVDLYIKYIKDFR